MIKKITATITALFLSGGTAVADTGPVIPGVSPMPTNQVVCGLSSIAQSCQQLPTAATPSGVQRVLGSLRGANFNSTADQAIPIPSTISAFTISQILVTNCSVSLTLAVGGFYPTTSKGGTPIVAATQIYSSLTSASVLLPATIAATPLITRYSIGNVYFSLTTAQGTAATCDIYVVGVDLT